MGIGEWLLRLLENVGARSNPSTAAAPTARGGDVGQSLQKLRNRIRTTLRDADRRKVRRESTALWLRDLQDLADDVDHVLDDFQYEELRRRVAAGAAAGGDTSYGSGSRGPDCSPNQLDVSMHGTIADIWRRFDAISKQREALLLPREFDAGTSQLMEHPNSQTMRETTSFLTVPQVLGRDGVQEEVTESLVGTPEERLSFVAIVGIGGVGKTTLAKLVYNDSRVGDHFHQKIWVHVSSDFDVKRVTRQILEHVADPHLPFHQMDNLNVLQETLANRLTDKRFLLVLDDMWYEDRMINNLEFWEALCAPLIYGGLGSKVLVTTRSARVVGISLPTKTIPLAGLDFENSWSLFKKHAFPDGNSERHPNLEDIGKRIVRNLKGVPLAVAAIGSMLCSESEESEWTSILESDLWELEQGEGGILPSLRLSYEHLPPHLRPCFTYFSMFPKGFRFDKLEIIQQWMALGYMQSHDNNRRMEDVGAEYLHCLLGRSLIQNSEDKYVVHDLLHDLGRFASLYDFLEKDTDQLHEIASEDGRQHHLSLNVNKPPEPCELEKLQNLKKLHTLSFWFSYKGYFQIPLNLFMHLTCLRVLDLSYGGFQDLPDSLGNLRHLRYLDLGRSPITNLPESLCCLYMLQTLRLEGCDRLENLPKGMGNLINLRYLEARQDLVSGISGIGKLVHLQELEVFSISEGDEGIKLEDLKNMNELRGRLCIQNLQTVVSREEASRANLKNKKYIKQLALEWAEDSGVNNPINVELEEAVLDALLPPPGLKELSISFYKGARFPGWMKHYQTVTGLESISLQKCQKCVTLPPLLEQLPCVKTLDIGCFPQMKELPPLLPATLVNLRLQDIKLSTVSSLERLSKLEELVLCNIPDLKELSPLSPTLMKLTMENLGLEVLPEFFQPHNRVVTIHSANTNAHLFLRELRIVGCQNLRALGGILQHHLQHLQVLNIKDCREVQCWPEEEGFHETLLSLRDELCIENCPKLKALPEGSIISSSLKRLRVKGCPDFPDKSFFAQLQNMKDLTQKGALYVKKPYRDLASCFEEALDEMRAADVLRIEAVDHVNASGELPFISLVCGASKSNPRQMWVTLYVSSTSTSTSTSSSDDDEDSSSYNSTLWACLHHHRLRNSLIELYLQKAPSDGFLLPQGAEAATSSSPDLPSLGVLVFSDCRDMERLPVEMLLRHLRNLKYLCILACPQLMLPSVEEAIQSLPSLVKLEILRCPKISSLPIPDAWADNEMPVRVLEDSSSTGQCCLPYSPPSSSSSSLLPLQTFITDNIGLLAGRQFASNHLTSLRNLTIWCCNIESFSMANEFYNYWPRSLQVLTFLECPYLQEQPPNFCNLFPSLRCLVVRSCPRLRCIPQMGLPPSLEVLEIRGSPGIEVEDWPKVAHVRLILVDGRKVKGSYSDVQEMHQRWVQHTIMNSPFLEYI